MYCSQIFYIGRLDSSFLKIVTAKTTMGLKGMLKNDFVDVLIAQAEIVLR